MSAAAHPNDKREAFVEAPIKIASIIFLSYSNLLMGEFTRNHIRFPRTL